VDQMTDRFLLFNGGRARTAAADRENCHVEKYPGSRSFGTIDTTDRR
jgi:hypothetical protein